MRSHKCTSLASWICLANFLTNSILDPSQFLHMILSPCAHTVRVLVCSKYIFLPFQPLTHHQLSLQVRGLWLIFFQSPRTSLLSWTTEQAKMPRALTAPCPLLIYKHRNVLNRGSVLHSGYGKASQHLPKVHATDNKDPRCTSVYSSQLRRTTGRVCGSFTASNHRAQRCASPCAGRFGDYSWAQCDSP